MMNAPAPRRPPDDSNENSGRISSRGAAVFQPSGVPPDPGDGDSAREATAEKMISAKRKVMRLIVIKRGFDAHALWSFTGAVATVLFSDKPKVGQASSLTVHGA